MIKPIIDLSARTLEYDTGKQAILELLFITIINS